MTAPRQQGEYIGDVGIIGPAPVQPTDEQGNVPQLSEQDQIFREMLFELKAIRIGLQTLLDTDEDLLELAHEKDDEIPS